MNAKVSTAYIMNSNNVSILESIKQEQHFNSIFGCVDVGKDGPDNDSPIENTETALQKLKDVPFDLKKNINCEQKIENGWKTTPMIEFCSKGDLLMCRFLKQHGATCTKRDSDGDFPMYVAAYNGKLKVCQWLYNGVGGGGAAEDINQPIPNGWTPLSESIDCGYVSQVKWILLHGGAQQLSGRAVDNLRTKCRDTYSRGPEIVAWTRMSIAFHDVTFFLFLCGASSTSTNTSSSTSTHTSTTINDINTTASSSSSSSVIPPSTNLPLLIGQPGVMELIGHYAGLFYGKEIRMLKEFHVLVDVEIDSDDYY